MVDGGYGVSVVDWACLDLLGSGQDFGVSLPSDYSITGLTVVAVQAPPTALNMEHGRFTGSGKTPGTKNSDINAAVNTATFPQRWTRAACRCQSDLDRDFTA